MAFDIPALGVIVGELVEAVTAIEFDVAEAAGTIEDGCRGICGIMIM